MTDRSKVAEPADRPSADESARPPATRGQPDGDDRTRAAALEAWFERAARDLPWRRRRSGWSALVAEAMLQQTQVSRVVERYETFIERFPSPAALAAADETEVLGLWSGLGYYRRARNLRAAAVSIVERFGGVVPESARTLRSLPGVGRYTAGAIASIVFGERTPLVDGNVRRVLCRWADRPGDGPTATEDRWTWDRAASLVEVAERPGRLNEALMELGATVCTPARPRCEHCPVAGPCRARAAGRAEAVPAPQAAAARRDLHHHPVVIVRAGAVLLRPRPEGGLWAGLWSPPAVETDRPLDPAEVTAALEVSVSSIEPVGRLEHLTTHRRVILHVHRASTRIRRVEPARWWPLGDLAAAPLSSAHRRVLAVAAVR